MTGSAEQTQRTGNRVILWGVGVCLVLLLIELSVLAATGNWLAVSATVVALAGVVAPTLVRLRRGVDLADAVPPQVNAVCSAPPPAVARPTAAQAGTTSVAPPFRAHSGPAWSRSPTR